MERSELLAQKLAIINELLGDSSQSKTITYPKENGPKKHRKKFGSRRDTSINQTKRLLVKDYLDSLLSTKPEIITYQSVVAKMSDEKICTHHVVKQVWDEWLVKHSNLYSPDLVENAAGKRCLFAMRLKKGAQDV